MMVTFRCTRVVRVLAFSGLFLVAYLLFRGRHGPVIGLLDEFRGKFLDHWTTSDVDSRLKNMVVEINNMTSLSNIVKNSRFVMAPHGNTMINFTNLPVPEAFSQLNFYGNRQILKYQWYFKPRPEKVFSLNHAILQHSARSCGAKERHQLVILVMSLHHMTSQRQAIRDTWGSVSTAGTWPMTRKTFSVKLFFVLGVSKNSSLNTAVALEAEVKGDLILVDFEESYYNLSRKVLMSFKWVSEFCYSAEYVMKVDEDTYLNIPEFMKILHSRKWDNQIYGPLFMHDVVFRVGKYMVPSNTYPIDVYPPHVKGNLYFMATDVAMKILSISEYMPYVSIEDAFITGILAKIFNIRHVGLPRNLYMLFATATSCQLARGDKIVSQKVFVQTLYMTWARIKNPSLCRTTR